MVIVLSRSLVAALLAALVYWLLTVFTAWTAPFVIFFTLLTLLVVYGAPLSVNVSG